MIKIALCDDQQEEIARTRTLLKHYLASGQIEAEICTFTRGQDLLKAAETFDFQIFFLDIFMEGLDGVNVARALRRSDCGAAIIFTTTSREHALEGYEVSAVHYLLKPLTYEKLSQAMDRCQEIVAGSLQNVTVRSGKVDVNLPRGSIEYIEVYDKISHIHCAHGTLTTYTSLDALEKLLGGEPFLRCHRSYIINMEYVASIEDKHIVMKNGDLVLYPKASRRQVREAYMAYLISRTRSLPNLLS